MLFCFGQNSCRIFASTGPSTCREGPGVAQVEHHQLRCCSRHCNIPGGPRNPTRGEIQLPRGSFVHALHSKHLLFQIAFCTFCNNCECCLLGTPQFLAGMPSLFQSLAECLELLGLGLLSCSPTSHAPAFLQWILLGC